jgi:hypothetical protein
LTVASRSAAAIDPPARIDALIVIGDSRSNAIER